MPVKTTFIKDQQIAALRLRQSGVSRKEVAARFGVKPDTIYRLEKRMSFTGDAHPVKERLIGFRLSEDEYRAFTALASEHGYKSRSDFARALARAATGFLEVSDGKRQALADMAKQVQKVGVNVNQIAYAANKGRIELVRAEWESLRDLRDALTPVLQFLRRVVAESRREGVYYWRRSEYGPEGEDE